MSMRALLNPILNNDRLTNGLDDAEGRMLIEWLVERVEQLASVADAALVDVQTRQLCRHARGIARFVALWCHEDAPGPALQLAATERFGWPLPVRAMDACDLMDEILTWEDSARNGI